MPWRVPPLPAGLRSLKVKFIAATLLMVGTVIGLSTWYNLHLHRGHMIRATEDKVRALTDAVDRRIYASMAQKHIQDLPRIVELAGQDPDIERILILDLEGRIRLASRPELVGQRLDRGRMLRHLDQPETVVAGHYEGGRLIQSMVRKIRNGPECVGCHGSHSPVNALLHVDMSFRQTQEQIAEMERGALWTVLLTGLVLASGGGSS